jgi:hypothetical protein
VSNRVAHIGANASVCQDDTDAGVVERSIIAICGRSSPSTLVKVPVATSFVPSGLMSKCATRSLPRRLSVKSSATFGSTAPVVALTAAKRPRVTPLTDVKAPPM